MAELLDLLVEVGRHARDLRLRQRVDAQRLDELVHPARRDAREIAIRDDRDQRRLRSFAALEQPLRKVRPGPQLRDLHVDRADPSIQRALPVAVALRRPVRRRTSVLSTDDSIGIGRQQGVDHRLQQ